MVVSVKLLTETKAFAQSGLPRPYSTLRCRKVILRCRKVVNEAPGILDLPRPAVSRSAPARGGR